MITGGSALGFWGHVRTTMDIDIVIHIFPRQVDSFIKSVKDESFVDSNEAQRAIQQKDMFNVIHNETCFKVDVIPLNDRNVYELEKFKRRVKINFLNRDIFVISAEDLIISKLLWSKSAGGSERQLRDCESIYRLNRDNLDLSYITKWIRELGIEKEFNNLTLRQKMP
jgi:hypothetical protein